MKRFIQNADGLFDVLDADKYLYYVNEIELRAMRIVLDEYKIKYSVTRKGYDSDGNEVDCGTEVVFNAETEHNTENKVIGNLADEV